MRWMIVDRASHHIDVKLHLFNLRLQRGGVWKSVSSHGSRRLHGSCSFHPYKKSQASRPTVA